MQRGVSNAGGSDREPPFKSEGERQIGRFLQRYGFNYLYEHPIALIEQEKVRIWYPDFTLPEYGIVIEYAGLDGAQYQSLIERKRAVYNANSVPFIFIDANFLKGNWPKRMLEQIVGVERSRYLRLLQIIENNCKSQGVTV